MARSAEHADHHGAITVAHTRGQWSGRPLPPSWATGQDADNVPSCWAEQVRARSAVVAVPTVTSRSCAAIAATDSRAKPSHTMISGGAGGDAVCASAVGHPAHVAGQRSESCCRVDDAIPVRGPTRVLHAASLSASVGGAGSETTASWATTKERQIPRAVERIQWHDDCP